MFFKRLLGVLLCAVMLLADSGQMVYAHTCLKSRHTTYSVATSQTCCNAAGSAVKTLSFRKGSCCVVSAKYFKQSLPAQKETLHVVVLAPHIFNAARVFESILPVPSFTHQLSLLNASRSSGTDDIPFLQVFRC